MVAYSVHLISPAEEIQRASGILRRLAVEASGQDWSVATEKLSDDGRVIGVANERDETVMGDCMPDVNNEVAEEDAKLISAMDPGTALLLADWLHVAGVRSDAASWPNDSIGGALKIARRINAKFRGVTQWEGRSL